GNSVGELAAGVALVADDRFTAGERARQQRQRDLALGTVGRDQRRGPRGAIGRASEMQPAAPKPAGMALRVAVTANVAELRATGRLEGAAAPDGCRNE